MRYKGLGQNLLKTSLLFPAVLAADEIYCGTLRRSAARHAGSCSHPVSALTPAMKPLPGCWKAFGVPVVATSRIW